MNRRLVYILVLVALGFILTATTKYLPRPAVVGVLLVITLFSLTRFLIVVRKKTVAAGQVTGLQKVSVTVISSSAIGAVIAFLFIVFHQRHIGLPLLNFSLLLFLAGVVVGIIALIRPGDGNSDIDANVKRRTSVFIAVVYLGTICTVAGLLLRINRYPGGKLLMFGGLAFVAAFMIFLIVYKKYVNEKNN